MAFPAPTDIANPLREIGAKGFSLQDIADIADSVEGLFADMSIAGAEEAAPEVATGILVGIIDAVGSVVIAIILLILLLILAILILAHYTIRSQIARLPFVGGRLAGITDFAATALLASSDFVWSKAVPLWTGIIFRIHTIIAGLIAIFGLPTIDYVHGAINGLQHELNRIPYQIDTATNAVSKALAISIGSIWHNINLIWPWIHHLLGEVAIIQNTIKSLWGWIHHLLSEVALLTAAITWLAAQVTEILLFLQWIGPKVIRLESEVLTLQHQVQALQTRVLNDEAAIAPALESAAIMVLLAPLLENGPQGIATLQELEVDPCKCLFTPGSKGWALTMMVMYLWWRDGV